MWGDANLVWISRGVTQSCVRFLSEGSSIVQFWNLKLLLAVDLLWEIISCRITALLLEINIMFALSGQGEVFRACTK